MENSSPASAGHDAAATTIAVAAIPRKSNRMSYPSRPIHRTGRLKIPASRRKERLQRTFNTPLSPRRFAAFLGAWLRTPRNELPLSVSAALLDLAAERFHQLGVARDVAVEEGRELIHGSALHLVAE